MRADGDSQGVDNIGAARGADVAGQGQFPFLACLPDAVQLPEQAPIQQFGGNEIGIGVQTPQHERAVEKRQGRNAGRQGHRQVGQVVAFLNAPPGTEQVAVDELLTSAPIGRHDEEVFVLGVEAGDALQDSAGLRPVAELYVTDVQQVAAGCLMAVDGDVRAVSGDHGEVGGEGWGGVRAGQGRP